MGVRALVAISIATFVCACGGGGEEEEVGFTLADTGLYADPAAETLADGVREYTPRFELWSDGATKRRFVFLPPGSTVDTADMDSWEFPEGTKLWKEFSRDGVRVETRLMEKRGPGLGDWALVAFAWNDEQTRALEAPDGARDVLGTGHDIPSGRTCLRCHQETRDFVLGFAAIQLDHDTEQVDLKTLVDEGLLSTPPAGDAPYFPLPGTPVEQAAFGYLHGNCGGCHNPDSEVTDVVPVNLRLEVATLATPEETTIYTTTVGVPHNRSLGDAVTSLIEPGDSAASAIRVRMNARGEFIAMPPVGSELVDADGLAAVDAWANSIAAPTSL